MQTDFVYESPRDAAGVQARVTMFGDSRSLNWARREDLERAGFRTDERGSLDRLLDGPTLALGDVVIVDCPQIEARTIAALARLDDRIVRSGTHLIVTTSFDALDSVFSILDRSQPQILVLPSRAELVVAVGRLMPHVSSGRVREMSEMDRISLIRLSEQVDQIAQELDRMSARDSESEGRDRDVDRSFKTVDAAPLDLSAGGDGISDMRGAVESVSNKANARFALPDPALVRQMIAARQARARGFDAALFADPAWDMLLDLTAAHAERQQVSVTSLCIAAGVPATTALRWVKQMVKSGVFERIDDPSDRRRAFIALSERSRDAMARYFASIEAPLAQAA